MPPTRPYASDVVDCFLYHIVTIVAAHNMHTHTHAYRILRWAFISLRAPETIG